MKKLLVVVLMLSLGFVTLGCGASSKPAPAKTETVSPSGPTQQFPDPNKGIQGSPAPQK